MKNHVSHALLIALATGGVLTAVGCQDPVLLPPKDQSSLTGRAAAPAPSAPEKPRLPPEAPSSPTASAVRISDEILAACGIRQADAHFAFDSADLRSAELSALDKVAVCFTTGPLKGRILRIVGHADPRGSAEYNMALGQSRADSVATYMYGKGLDRSKGQSSTRGAMDAEGNDEPSWARDRRVDLMLPH